MSPPRKAALALALLPLLALPAAGLASEPLPPCLFDRVQAQGIVPPPAADDHNVAFEQCTGALRPGARMSGTGCTFNFVFDDAQGNLYIGTAGHCTSGVGQRVGAEGVGIFGTVVYDRNSGVNDFSLIRIDANKHDRVNPTLCTWGGPVGADPGGALPRDVFLEYGWGFATQFVPETRARVLGEANSYPTHITWNGVGSGGDSGAPIVNQAGYAMGIHTFGQTPYAGAVLEGGPSIGNILGMARTAVPTLDLVTGDPTSFENTLRGLTY